MAICNPFICLILETCDVLRAFIRATHVDVLSRHTVFSVLLFNIPGYCSVVIVNVIISENEWSSFISFPPRTFRYTMNCLYEMNGLFTDFYRLSVFLVRDALHNLNALCYGNVVYISDTIVHCQCAEWIELFLTGNWRKLLKRGLWCSFAMAVLGWGQGAQAPQILPRPPKFLIGSVVHCFY